MDGFRAAVSAILDGTAPAPVLIPPAELSPPAGQAPRPTLRRGAVNALVTEVQKKVGAAPTGTFDAATEAAVRAFQRDQGLLADGIVGPKTWAALDLIPR
jgi:peptidoglycan hydrolase-like protein with peptidoglycan-binding domain